MSALPGIGPKLEKLFARSVARDGEPPRIVDLLFHLPTGFVDRRNQPKLNEVHARHRRDRRRHGRRHRPPPPNRPRAPYNIDASDDTNTLTITYFNARKDYLEKLLPEGELRYVSGIATLYDGHLQMVHPDRVVDAEGFAKLPLIDPVYPLTEGLHPNQLRKAIDAALERLPDAAGMAGRGLARAQRLSEFRRRAAQHPPPAVAGRPRAGERARGRGSPMTNCWPASSRSRCCARTCASAPAAAAPPRASCARASLPRCPIR